MKYEDDVEDGAEVVRAFMVTRGRTTAVSEEFALETMVSPTSHGRLRAASLRFERQRIVSQFAEPIAIAEIAAVLGLPIRAVQVLASEMIGDGLLQRHKTIQRIDSSVLLRIRGAVAAL
jgi:hypothetical protein